MTTSAKEWGETPRQLPALLLPNAIARSVVVMASSLASIRACE